jgi:hypothetical protein
MKIEFHCHSEFSHDCSDRLIDKYQVYKDSGFDKVYITDHDHILNSGDPDFFAPGIEVSSTFGHIILLDCKRKPPINTLWFLVFWSKILKSSILIPHPNRKFTGLIERYNNKGLGVKYLNWFIANSNFIEHYNHRERQNFRKEYIQYSTYSLVLKLIGVYSSDSHSLKDIYYNGTVFINSHFPLIDSKKTDYFKSSYIISSEYFKMKKVDLIFHFLLTVRRSLKYLVFGKL